MSFVTSVYSEKELISRAHLYRLALGDEKAIKEIISIFLSTVTENIDVLECYISTHPAMWDNALNEIILCSEAVGAKELTKIAKESSKLHHQTTAQRRTCLINLKNGLRDVKLFGSKMCNHL